ncbi:HlyD family secretion protein [soil metagenome]
MSDTAAVPAPPPPRKGLSPRAKWILRGALLVAVIVVVVWFVHYQLRGKYFESTNDAYVQADAVTVSPKVSGYVEKVDVIDNQVVSAGAVLVRIDARDYQAQTAQFQSQIDLAKASEEGARASLDEQKFAIEQARVQLSRLEQDAAFAAGEVERYTPLAASGAETREKLASLRNTAALARQSAASQRASLSAAQLRVGSLQAQVRQAQAQGRTAQAQLAAADVNLGSTEVASSIDGRVGDKSVRVGQFVQAGTRLMSIVPTDAYYIVANFKETQIGLMRIGQPVTIQVDALPDHDIKGHVDSVAPGTGAQFSLLPPQNATGNFTKIVQRVPVRIAIEADPAARRVLVAGLSVTVTVDTIDAKHDLDQSASR